MMNIDAIKNSRGFTLIEVVMAIVLLGIVGITAGLLLSEGVRSFDALDKQKGLTGQGTLALERLSRELRRIRCTESGNSCAPSAADITAMTAAEIRFVNADYEGRGFRQSGTDLLLRQGSGAADPEDVLAGNLSALTFEYLKSDGSAATVAADVWFVNVNMTLTGGPESINLKASVHPRGFR